MADGLAGLGTKPKAKPKRVDLGKKGSFTIKKPGALRAKADAAGMSTRQFAQKHKGDKGDTGSQSRSAIGLMSMKKG